MSNLQACVHLHRGCFLQIYFQYLVKYMTIVSTNGKILVKYYAGDYWYNMIIKKMRDAFG